MHQSNDTHTLTRANPPSIIVLMLFLLICYKESFVGFAHLWWNGLQKDSPVAWGFLVIVGVLFLYFKFQAKKHPKNPKRLSAQFHISPLTKIFENLTYILIGFSAILMLIQNMVHLNRYYFGFYSTISLAIGFCAFPIYTNWRDKNLKKISPNQEKFTQQRRQYLANDYFTLVVYALIFAWLLFFYNLLCYFSEWQVEQNQRPSLSMPLIFKYNFDDSQLWHFGMENMPKNRFIIYNKNLNFNLPEKNIYQITAYKGYFNDTIIPVQSLQQAELIQE